MGGCVGLVFFGGFLLLFSLYFLAFRSRNCLENSIDVRSGFFLGSFSLPLVFSSSSSFSVFVFVFSFSRDKVQVVTGHPRTRTCFLVLFLFCVPPLLSVPPVLAVRPASWRFSGVPFWAPGVFGILLGLSEAFFWDARRQGSSCVALVLFFFSPFVLRPHLF